MRSPSIVTACARAQPISRGSFQLAPRSGTKPSLGAKVSTKPALSAASTTSAASAMLTPAPAQTPLTAASVGTGSSCSA